jgi:hypothetical protein
MRATPKDNGLTTDNMAQISTAGNILGKPPVSAVSSDNTRRAVGVAAATLLLGGGAALAFIPKAGKPPGSQAGTEKDGPFVLPPNAEVAQTVADSMTFEEAFAAARAEVGPGGVFVWHNQPYNTFWREEWAALSLQQRHEYAEHVLAAELPVRVATPQAAPPTGHAEAALHRPTVIEGYVGEQRVMGIDRDNDGIIDSLVIADADGNAYRVVDQTGGEGLDTLYAYDALTDEFRYLNRLDQPTLLTNAQLSEDLEEAMARQVVNDIMGTLPDTGPHAVAGPVAEADDFEENEAEDDTYVNNADVADMDYPAHEHGVE